MADHDTHDHTGVPGVGTTVSDIVDLPAAETDDTLRLAPDGVGGVEWASGGGVADDLTTAETDTSLRLAPDGAGGVEWAAGGGGALTTVELELSADFTTGSGSTWTDITGLTGISLTAGTWIASVDIEHVAGTSYGPVFRVSDGSTVYGQSGLLVSNPVAAVSTHLHFAVRPFTLGGSATMKVQYFSDTVFTVKEYPTRGSDSSRAATHITFLKIA